ncbi:MAG: hypothetical protein AAF387_20200, partial [Pseudomonadota bacterium]
MKALSINSLKLALCLTSVFAVGKTFAAFEDPSTADWGGWSRNSGDSLYLHWDIFEGLSGPSNPFTSDSSPDIGSYNVDSTTLSVSNPGAFITSTENV